jgi:HK97 family phage major capsid protein
MNKSAFNPQLYPAPLSGLKSNSTSPFAAYGTTKELMKRSYSVTDIIKAGRDFTQKTSMELEVSNRIAKNKGQDAPFGHVYIPSEILCRDLSVGVASAGGNLVQATVRPTLADALIPYSSLVASSITVLDDLQGNVSWPRWQTQFSPSGLLENATVLTTDESATISTMTLSPHRIGCEVLISRTLLAQSSVDVESAVQKTILQAIGALVDQYAINSGGAYPSTTGLLNFSENTAGSFSDLSKLAHGVTAGGPFTFASQVAMKGGVLANNVIDDGTFGFIVDPATWSKWSQAQKAVNYPSYLINDDGTALGHPVRVTNNLSATHQALFGRWSSAVLGIWAISILSDPYIFASTNQVRLQIDVLYDFSALYSPALIRTEDSAAQ